MLTERICLNFNAFLHIFWKVNVFYNKTRSDNQVLFTLIGSAFQEMLNSFYFNQPLFNVKYTYFIYMRSDVTNFLETYSQVVNFQMQSYICVCVWVCIFACV